MTRSVAVALAVLLFVGAALAPTVGAASGSDAGETRLVTPDGFTQTTFGIEAFANGTAEWTIAYSRPLENDTEREQFRGFAEEFERTETDLYVDFVERAGALVASGADATDREMEASNFDRSAFVDEFTSARGVVELSFHWSDFARADGERLRMGDVFEGGLYVGPDQRLVVEPGPTLAVTDARPDTYTASGDALESSSSITWTGEERFTDRHPRVDFAPASAVDDGATAAATETSGEPVPEPTRSSGDMLLLVGLFVVVVGLVGAAVWQSGALGDRGSPADGAAAAAATEAESAGPDQQVAPVEDREFLSDDDRVIRLLEENGGRMKQVNIVDQTEWSKSKVSMLLSEMEDEGAISKLRVGRENIISLSGHEPDAAGSPFDEEE